MADISITQPHHLSPDAARAAAQKVADKLSADYGLTCKWIGEVLHFERAGVDGTLTLGAREALLQIKLGFMMSALAPTIEQKVADNLRKVFA
jgi:putative polyhydroxyalkanoate system protein